MLKNFIKGYRFVVLFSDLYVLTAMTVSAALAARRTLVKLLLTLASAYAIALVLTRESTDIVVEAACKKVIRKVHPDKGGRNADAQKLNTAKEAWDKCRRPKGRPQSDGAPALEHR